MSTQNNQTQISQNPQLQNINNQNISNINNTNTTNTNLIEEFFFIYDEDNKLINFIKEEFSDLKFFNYGSIIYFQKENEEENSTFPHVSELLENYEKIYSQTCYKEHFILRLTKCKIFFLQYLIYFFLF